ncbi:hypothetical protein BSKO_10250 [Bryopsis sp. KO-2023]|nr:hypothetical protein BSKO_10250 [Bryopsis sp. KO-2023]
MMQLHQGDRCFSCRAPLSKFPRVKSWRKSSSLYGNGSRPLSTPRRSMVRSSRGRESSSGCRAMVNVELTSPALVLGLGLVGAGVFLFGVRKTNPEVSRDSDVVISSLITVTGGALIFQGWRLDPLLLLCQVMTCSVAAWFAAETLQLRGDVTETQRKSETDNAVEASASEFSQDSEDETFWYTEEDRRRESEQGAGLPPPRGQFSEWSPDFTANDAGNQWYDGRRQNEVSGTERGEFYSAGSVDVRPDDSQDWQSPGYGVGDSAYGQTDENYSDRKASTPKQKDTGRRKNTILESVEDWE